MSVRIRLHPGRPLERKSLGVKEATPLRSPETEGQWLGAMGCSASAACALTSPRERMQAATVLRLNACIGNVGRTAALEARPDAHQCRLRRRVFGYNRLTSGGSHLGPVCTHLVS